MAFFLGLKDSHWMSQGNRKLQPCYYPQCICERVSQQNSICTGLLYATFPNHQSLLGKISLFSLAYFSITSGYCSAQSFMACLGSSPAPPKGKCSAFKRTIPEMVRLILPDLTCLNDLLKMVQNIVIPGKAQSHSFPGHCWKY